jgi:hypothetical protein
MWRYRTPDGGDVEPTKARVVPMGDGGSFEQLTYRRGGVEVVFEVRERVPVCIKVLLTPDPDTGEPVRAKDLAEIRLDNLREDVYAAAGVFEGGPNLWAHVHMDGEDWFRRDRRKVREASKRRKITPEFLQHVAETHTAASGAKVAAVADAFGVDKRTAHRYIAAAREKGLIE